MKRIMCHWFGHDNIWFAGPGAGQTTFACLRCRRRKYVDPWVGHPDYREEWKP